MIETGVKFGDIHSFYDLNLIFAPFSPVPAQPKTEYLDVPGMDGSLDLTESMGEVKYYDREFTFIFTINPQDKMSFDEKFSQVSNALNGKPCKITVDRDAEYYWEGRCIVNEYLQDKRIGKIAIGARVRPYKLKQNPTVYSCKLTETEQIIVLKNGKMPAVPEILCTDDNTRVIFGAVDLNLAAGTHKVLDVRFLEGNNVLKVSGTGTITITYQEGEL